jgi:hypothetical protein
MHLPQFTIDTALSLNLAPAQQRVNYQEQSAQQTEPFYKLLEKAMDESRAADKARDDAQAAKAKEALERGEKSSSEPKEQNVGEQEKTAEVKREDNVSVIEDRQNVDKEARPQNEPKKEIPAREQNAQAFLGFKTKAINHHVSQARFVDRQMTVNIQETAAAPQGDEPKEARAEPSVQNELAPKDFLLKQILENAATDGAEQSAAGGARHIAVPHKKERAEDGAGENAAGLFAPRSGDAQNGTGIEAIFADQNALGGEALQKAEKKFFEGDKPLFTVIDERVHEARQEKGADVSARIEGNQAEMTLTAAAKETAGASFNSAERGAESKFASMLSQEIKNSAAEFVKAGTIILRDHDSGSIRLLLNPKDLGDVKILLQLTDNNITARISVSTMEAYDAFKSSIDSLKQAFNDSGFSTGEFDLGYAGSAFGGSENSNAGTHGEQPPQAAAYSASQYVKEIPDAAPLGEIAESGGYAVNVTA